MDDLDDVLAQIDAYLASEGATTHTAAIVDASTDDERGERVERLRSALLGASVRGDRFALDAALRDAATLFGVSEERALAEFVQRLFDEAPTDDAIEYSALRVEDLERLPREYLTVVAFQLVRVNYTDAPPPSRAS